jgi:hypothetical protein
MIDTYVRHSPSSLNLFASCISMFVAERIKGIKQQVGVPAHRGTAVEEGVTVGLMLPDTPLKDCIDVAILAYDNLTALSPDPRREQYRRSIPDMVTAALGELRAYGVPTGTQGWVEWNADGCELPIVGKYDYEWTQHGIIADLKTTEKMPSAIKVNHARQVALYSRSDNARSHLIYVTPKKIEAYKLENIAAHRQSLANIARAVEKFLSLSDDPDYFVSITAPDIDSFYWSNPTMRQVAYRLWGV